MRGALAGLCVAGLLAACNGKPPDACTQYIDAQSTVDKEGSACGINAVDVETATMGSTASSPTLAQCEAAYSGASCSDADRTALDSIVGDLANCLDSLGNCYNDPNSLIGPITNSFGWWVSAWGCYGTIQYDLLDGNPNFDSVGTFVDAPVSIQCATAIAPVFGFTVPNPAQSICSGYATDLNRIATDCSTYGDAGVASNGLPGWLNSHFDVTACEQAWDAGCSPDEYYVALNAFQSVAACAQDFQLGNTADQEHCTIAGHDCVTSAEAMLSATNDAGFPVACGAALLDAGL